MHLCRTCKNDRSCELANLRKAELAELAELAETLLSYVNSLLCDTCLVTAKQKILYERKIHQYLVLQCCCNYIYGIKDVL